MSHASAALVLVCFPLDSASLPRPTAHSDAEAPTLPHSSREDDSNWPHADKVGRQELEIVLGDEHISFTVSSPSLNILRHTAVHASFMPNAVLIPLCGGYDRRQR